MPGTYQVAPGSTAAGAVDGGIETEVRAMKFKHRVMLWYANRKAKKQAQGSRDQVPSASRKPGSKAASGARSAKTSAARSTRSAGSAIRSTGGRAAKSAGASARKTSGAAKSAGRRPSGSRGN